MKTRLSFAIAVCLLDVATSSGLCFAASAVSVSVTPILKASQKLQFATAFSGTSWSLNPVVGTLSSQGLYTAPPSILAVQTIGITATSLSDPSKSEYMMVMLMPIISLWISPAASTILGGTTQQFHVTTAGGVDPSVVWSLNPSVGSISSTGMYTAPSSITSVQTVTVTATSLVDPTRSASATLTINPVISITISPLSARLNFSQTQQFTATIAGAANQAVNWSITPAVGSISTSGLYTAPATTAGGNTVTVIAKSAADPTKSASATITITASIPTKITLPIEVVGPAGTTESVVVTIPPGVALSGSQKLWMQIHGLRYPDKASVQVNSGPWVGIDDASVTLLGLSKAYGGIGGGFDTHKMTLDLPPGTLVAGNNTVSFRFNATQGGLGFRVLKFNFLTADGTMLLPQDLFVEDDPNTWQPPLNTPADIAEGKRLFQQASILHAGKPVNAHCNNCHTQDGRDLKYFNYSNKFLHYGAVISGLTATQGDQIASYIRSLNTPNPGRPWNPPYQPGPGMDSKPVSEWAAGAGIDAVLDHDSDMLPYLMPGGSTTTWAWNSYLNARETPIALQLPDWNHWLPTVNPIDGWGATFINDPLNIEYLNIRSQLKPNDPTAYLAVYGDIRLWGLRWWNFQQMMLQNPNWSDANYVARVYSVSSWSMIKLWEINQEFGLEGMSSVVFGPQAANRAWYTGMAFDASPFFSKIPRPSPGIGNGSLDAYEYLAFIWYQLQLILNDGNGTAQGLWPIDWAYSLSYPENNLTSNQTGTTLATAGLLMEWLIKALQSGDQAGGAKQSDPYALVMFPGQVKAWSALPASQKVQIMTAWVTTWLARFSLYTPQQLFALPDAPQTIDWTVGNIPTHVAWALPLLRYEGVDPNLLNQLAAWAARFWPSYNWVGALYAPCAVTNSSSGEVKCTIP